jgi:hypothetical protein
MTRSVYSVLRLKGAGFVVDNDTFVAKFPRDDSILTLRNMAFGHRMSHLSDERNKVPHIFRAQFGDVFWLWENQKFVAFTHPAGLSDYMLRGRCELVGPP